MTNDSIIAKEEKDPWDLLTMQEQYVFIEKAKYLLNYNYIQDPYTPEQLGRVIYLSRLEMKNASTDDTGVRGESNGS